MRKKLIFIAAAILVSLFAARMPLAQEVSSAPTISVAVLNLHKEPIAANYHIEPSTAEYSALLSLLKNAKCRIGVETFFKSPSSSVNDIDVVYRIRSFDFNISFTAYERGTSLVAVNDTFYRVDQSFFSELENILSTLPVT